MKHVEIITVSSQAYFSTMHEALLADESVVFVNGIVDKKRRSWFGNYRAISIARLAKKYGLDESYVLAIAQLGIDVQVKVVTDFGSFLQLVFVLIESILKHDDKKIVFSDIGRSPGGSDKLLGVLAVLEPVIHQHNLQVKYIVVGN